MHDVDYRECLNTKFLNDRNDKLLSSHMEKDHLLVWRNNPPSLKSPTFKAESGFMEPVNHLNDCAIPPFTNHMIEPRSGEADTLEVMPA
ncbi:hypothetical protein SAMD00019534_006360 [Acytostelium subglobosum LB1]|uniref:hypothetical protein n=1 Tax=Acytostelium subglobosum LB1 TaxID=1410327 RepID=UPI000644E4A9|nr:hypothetical protein SAMD00019534_006360 [Acytostelium subglobosum LB1]GAM17461.1 hypothetical protein SAMD00019534_006360 [Acytostelium subglobosum LB1]|eukprot:XP_012759523.1 hypothetical protein SAMD00019534_006360 [Acytostelium subglobosum LB1]